MKKLILVIVVFATLTLGSTVFTSCNNKPASTSTADTTAVIDSCIQIDTLILTDSLRAVK